MIPRVLVLALVVTAFAALTTVGPHGHPVSPPTSFATSGATWADLDCSGEITTADPLQGLLEFAGLPGNAAQFCPLFNSPVQADGEQLVQGDINCDGVAGPRDMVELLADLASVGANTDSCPAVGAPVELALLAGAFEAGEGWRDYGDAPEGAPTFYSGGAATGSFPTSAGAGPSHQPPFPFRLGEFETAEAVPLEEDDADDGLLWLDTAACETSTALLSISLGGLSAQERDEPLYVNIFGDWDRDGDWDDTDGCTDDWALQNFALDVSGEPDFTVLTVDFPGGDQVSEFWMRLMLTDSPYNPATDNLLAGETEDYLITGGQVAGGGPAPAGVTPQGPPLIADGVGNSFLCKGGVVPHGGESVTFDMEQTTASKVRGLDVGRVSVDIDQPQDEEGERATGVTVGSATVGLFNLSDGRARVRIRASVATTEDEPDRLEGPFTISVFMDGREPDGDPFSGFRQCAFYVDHAGGAAQDPDRDGFRGGPDRAAPTGDNEPRFVFIPHGRTLRNFATDAMRSPDELRGSRYDKDSLTVFGEDGAVIAGDDLEDAAGIKQIKVASRGRGIEIKTVRDDRDPPVQRVVIRLMGTLPGGETFWDYYRVVIVHERGADAERLVEEWLESGVAYNFIEPGDADVVTFTQDDEALVSMTPPIGDLVFDDLTGICDTEGQRRVHSPFFGSLGFVLDYPGDVNSDLYFLPEATSASGEIGVAWGPPCPQPGANNLTNFGPSSPFYILDAAACWEKAVFTEFNTFDGSFRLGAVNLGGNSLAPVPGGDLHRDPSCFWHNGFTGIVASTPGAEGRSNGGFVPLLPCNATCVEGESSIQGLPAAKIIIEADAPNVHIRSLAVSPDNTKIAWYRQESDSEGTVISSHIWIGDFDAETQTVTNHQQLTTEGFNFDLAWSPDSSQLAFVSFRDDNFDIYVMNADGSNQTNMTNTPDIGEFEPSWQVP